MASTTQQNQGSTWLTRSIDWYRDIPKALFQHQVILFTASIISIVVDQLTKWWVEDNIPLYDAIIPIESIGHILDFLHVKNPGAAFGTGQELGWLFATVAFIVSAGILFYNTVIIGRHFAFRLSLGLIMGGALGNVIDRFRIGEVTDFIHFDFRPLVSEAMAEAIPLLNFAIFNLADLSIFSGVIIMFWLMWKDTLPEDPWLDEPEPVKQTEIVPPSSASQVQPPVQAMFKPQAAAPQAIYDRGAVSSGLTKAPFDPNSAYQGNYRSKTNWRGNPELDDEAESYARFGLIVGLILGVSLIAAVVWLFMRRKR